MRTINCSGFHERLKSLLTNHCYGFKIRRKGAFAEQIAVIVQEILQKTIFFIDI